MLRMGVCVKQSGHVALLQSLISECMEHLTLDALFNVELDRLYALDTFISFHKSMNHWLISLSSRKKAVVRSFKKVKKACCVEKEDPSAVML